MRVQGAKRPDFARRNSTAGCPVQHGLRRPRPKVAERNTRDRKHWNTMCEEMQELGLVLPVAKTQMNEMHNEQMLGERCSLCALFILLSASGKL